MTPLARLILGLALFLVVWGAAAVCIGYFIPSCIRAIPTVEEVVSTGAK